MRLNLKRIWKPAVIFAALCCFAYLCAAAIAESEIIASYRWLVYLGTGLALAAFALAVIFVYFFSLARTASGIKKALEQDDPVMFLEDLLSKKRSPASKSAVTLALCRLMISRGETERAKAVSDVLDPSLPFVFNRKLWLEIRERTGNAD